MKDYRAFIANCIIGGEEFQNGKRNLIKLTLGNLILELSQRDNFYKRSEVKKHKGDILYTTDVYIKNLNRRYFSTAQKTIKYLCELLSFVTYSDVFSFGYKYYSERYKKCIGAIQTSCPLINLINGKEIRLFLECVWSQYMALRDSRQLNVVIDYYTSAEHPQNAIEIKLTIIFILLENLKHTFAKIKGYPFIGGYFRVIGSTSTRNRTKSFKSLLTEMLIGVGMRPNLDDIIKIRNAIIHSGLSNIPFDERLKIYRSCQDIIREYLLKLLDFRGRYKLCGDNEYKTL